MQDIGAEVGLRENLSLDRIAYCEQMRRSLLHRLSPMLGFMTPRLCLKRQDIGQIP